MLIVIHVCCFPFYRLCMPFYRLCLLSAVGWGKLFILVCAGKPYSFQQEKVLAIHPRHPRHPCHPGLTTNASSHCSRDIAPPPCMRSKIKLHGALAPQLSLICTHPNITHLIFSSRRTSIDSTRSRIVIPTGDLYRASCRYLG